MPRIYTRTGDDGTTSLGSRKRVRKDDLRVAGYGEIDELNSVIGLARSMGVESEVSFILGRIQKELFELGADLAFPLIDDNEEAIPRIGEKHTNQLERDIDMMNKELRPLRQFILPGGSPAASALHVARAVCRRAERSVVSLNNVELLDTQILIYINRLSDALFVMARFENQRKAISEPVWDSESE